jgi:activator of 2-hydroxyglutaryl-CoA dehydratase
MRPIVDAGTAARARGRPGSGQFETISPVAYRSAAMIKFQAMAYIIGIDTGGTFPACVVMEADGRLVTAKATSTPDEFSEGVLE